MASYEKDGHARVFSALEKKCAGSCDNVMAFTDGNGENDLFRHVSVLSIAIDEEDQELTIKGEQKGFGLTGDKQLELVFKDCDVNEDLVKEIAHKLE